MLVGLGLMVGWYASRPGRGELTSMLYNKPSVMTVAYKAYGNPQAANGKYWLSKIVLENTGKGPLRDVKVSYQIPDYITWTSPDQVPELQPGQSAVFVWYPKFPASVTKLRSKTPASLEVKFEYNDGSQNHSRIEKREFALRGVTEFEFTSLPASEIVSYYDLYDNQELAAAYVTDEDPAVKTYYTKVSEVSGGINIINGERELVQLARSIYDFMVSTGMTYSGAKGVPESTGDSRSFVQSMRLPRDVIYGNSGLCVELAYLWASLSQSAGAKPYLVFIPGHCFVILESLDGTQLPVECTMIGGGAGGNMEAAGSFQQAVESASKTLQQVMQQGQPITILDVQQYQGEGIRPPELEDVNRPELVRFLDDLRARRGNSNGNANNNQLAMNNNNNNNQPVPPPGGDPNQNPNPNPNVDPNPQPVPPPGVDPNVNPNPQPQPDPNIDPNSDPGFDPNPQPVPPPGVDPNPNPMPGPGPGPGPGPNPQPAANMTVWQDGQNRMSLPYPNTWQRNDQMLQQYQQYFPGYVLSAADPQTGASVDVIFFDRLDMQKAAETLLNFFTQMGANPQAGQGQMTEISGRKTLALPVTLQGQMGPIQGVVNIITTNSGVVAVSVFAPGQSTQAAAPVFGQILGGIRMNG